MSDQTDERVVIYQAFHDGCGFAKNQEIGTFKRGFGFTIRKHNLEEKMTVLFALLPDDFILKGDHGEIISMGQLRKTLRGHSMRQVGIQNCPILKVNDNSLYPQSMEDTAGIYLLEFLEQHPVTDYHSPWISNIQLDEKSITETQIKIKVEYMVRICRYRKQNVQVVIWMVHNYLKNWWEAKELEILLEGISERHYRVCTYEGRASFEEINMKADLTLPVDPKPLSTGRGVYGYYGVGKIRQIGKLIGTYYPQDVPDIIHPRIMPEIPEGYELVGITARNSEEVAPILTEPSEFERFVIDLQDNSHCEGINRLELYLIEQDKLALCPDKGAVKITE